MVRMEKQMKAFERKNRRDPRFYSENQMPAHSNHVFSRNMEEAETGISSYTQSMNGLWQFFYAENEQEIPSGYEDMDFDCHDWTQIHVPAHIQLEGYGRPQYCNLQYPWDGWEDTGEQGVPETHNPVGCYVKYFKAPKHFIGKRVFVTFEGVESCVAIWLNGQYIGYGSNSFSPSEFELTDALIDGENKLVAEVLQWSAGSLLEDQDFFRFSGIFRDVFLYAIPDVHIYDLCIKGAY